MLKYNCRLMSIQETVTLGELGDQPECDKNLPVFFFQPQVNIFSWLGSQLVRNKSRTSIFILTLRCHITGFDRQPAYDNIRTKLVPFNIA